jgi:hypothetical protein
MNTPGADADALGTATQPGQRPGDSPLVCLGQFDGANLVRVWTPTVFKPQSAVSVASEATIWTPTSGKKFRWLMFQLMGDQTGLYTFKDNTAGTTIFSLVLTANVALPYTQISASGLLSAAANNVLTCTGPASSHLSGIVAGAEV